MGCGMGGVTTLTEAMQTLLEKGIKRMSPFFIPYSMTNMGLHCWLLTMVSWVLITRFQLLVQPPTPVSIQLQTTFNWVRLT